MGFSDYTDDFVRGLAQVHRLAREERREAARLAHERLRFPFVPWNEQERVEASWRDWEDWERHPPHVQWKRDQWEAGNRHCGYCGHRMTRNPNLPLTCTVDHRRPRAFGGKDDPSNWLMACNGCNGRKGHMSESMFRALLASENTPRARRLTA